jgi:hypothetical protein
MHLHGLFEYPFLKGSCRQRLSFNCLQTIPWKALIVLCYASWQLLRFETLFPRHPPYRHWSLWPLWVKFHFEALHFHLVSTSEVWRHKGNIKPTWTHLNFPQNIKIKRIVILEDFYRTQTKKDRAVAKLAARPSQVARLLALENRVTAQCNLAVICFSPFSPCPHVWFTRLVHMFWRW